MRLSELPTRLATGAAGLSEVRRALEVETNRHGLELITRGAASLTLTNERLGAFVTANQPQLSTPMRDLLGAVRTLMGEARTRLTALLNADGSLPFGRVVDIAGLIDDAVAAAFANTPFVVPTRIPDRVAVTMDMAHFRWLFANAGRSTMRGLIEARDTTPEEQAAFDAWIAQARGQITANFGTRATMPQDPLEYQRLLELVIARAEWWALLDPLSHLADLASSAAVDRRGAQAAALVTIGVIYGYARAAPRQHRELSQARMALSWAAQAMREV